MRAITLVCLNTLFTIGTSISAQQANDDFLSIGRNQHEDRSGRVGDHRDKYFHESSFHQRYDGRFADHPLSSSEQSLALKALMKTYLATLSRLGIETWLMHVTLLGWWWNKEILPWDSNLGVQISENSIYYLAAYYNMSTYWFRTPGASSKTGRTYLLEISPHYKNREQTDMRNVVDARWIDMQNGLFIDITVARYNLTHPGGEGMMSCKDGQDFKDTYIFPLRSTTFEGAPVKIPFRYKHFLVAEYGEEALANTDYNDYRFDDDRLEWISKTKDQQLAEDRKLMEEDQELMEDRMLMSPDSHRQKTYGPKQDISQGR